MKTALLVVRWTFAFLAWCLFLFWWKKAATPGWVSPRAVAISLLSIGIVISAAILYSTFWILHNKRIARHGKRGFVSFYKSPRFEADALGRKLTLPADAGESVLIVRNVGDRKEYVVDTGKAKGVHA